MKTITTRELKQKLNDNNRNFILLNVLSEEIFREEHIPTSKNIAYEDEDFLEKVSAIAQDKNAEIIVYCANKECPASSKAAEKLEAAGYKSIIEYEGGTQGWKDAHYEVAA